MADAIVTSSADGAIGSFNRSARQLFGYSEAEVLGRPLQLIIETARPGGDLLGRRKDGSSFALEMNVSETHIGDRAVTIGCIRDVTERREQADRDRQNAQALEQAQFEMLARLAAAAEFRDDDTGQHTRRVGDLSVTIAERLGVPEDQVELMRLAAPLHDIGKIAIPDSVLGKPGRLTAAEFERDEGAHDRRRADARRQRVRAARDGRADRANAPRALGRQRISRRAGRRGDPDRRADRRRRRRLRRAHPRAAVQAGMEPGGRDRGDTRRRPAGASTPTSSRRSLASIRLHFSPRSLAMHGDRSKHHR